MKQLKQMARRLHKLADTLPTQASNNSTRLALDITQSLVVATPVDTSEALSNWEANVGVSPTGSIPPHVPGHKGSTRLPSSKKAVALSKSGLATKKPGVAIYITNNVDHIGYLNAGHSPQQPEPKFVERQVGFAVKRFVFKWKL